MKTTTILLIVGGVVVLGGGFLLVRSSNQRARMMGVPPTPMGFGPANTPQQQFAALTGSVASSLATTGINKLKALFN